MCKTIQKVGRQTQRTDANVDTVRTLVRSDRRVGVRVTAELNMNRDTVLQIVKEDLGTRKVSAKMVSRIVTRDQKRRLHNSSNFYAMQRCLIGSLPVMNHGVCNSTRKTKRMSMQWKKQKSPRPKKSMHVLVAGQDHACVFLRSQGDSSLRVHCTRTKGKSAVLFGSADKVSGTCSEEKTRTLSDNWILEHDNAHAHDALRFR